MSSWTSAAAVMKPTERPFWQAAKPRPRAMWVLPVPLLPSAMRFSRRSMYSQRASSRTNVLLSEGMTLKSKLSRLLITGKRAALMRRSTHAALAVDQLELGKTQKIANVVDAFRGTLPGDLVVLPQERRQLQPLEVVDEQHLPCVGHAPSPDSRLMYDLADVIATRARGRYG